MARLGIPTSWNREPSPPASPTEPASPRSEQSAPSVPPGQASPLTPMVKRGASDPSFTIQECYDILCSSYTERQWRLAATTVVLFNISGKMSYHIKEHRKFIGRIIERCPEGFVRKLIVQTALAQKSENGLSKSEFAEKRTSRLRRTCLTTKHHFVFKPCTFVGT